MKICLARGRIVIVKPVLQVFIVQMEKINTRVIREQFQVGGNGVVPHVLRELIQVGITYIVFLVLPECIH